MPVTSARRADSAGIDSGIGAVEAQRVLGQLVQVRRLAGESPSKRSRGWRARAAARRDRPAAAVVAELRRSGGAAASEPSTPAPAAVAPPRRSRLRRVRLIRRSPPSRRRGELRQRAAGLVLEDAPVLVDELRVLVGHVHELLRVVLLVVEALAPASLSEMRNQS